MSNEDESSPIPVSPLVQTIGIFSLVGVGLGLSGGFAITQIGGGGGISGGILSGVLVLVTLMTAFLIAPLVGVITGLRIGDHRGQTSESYLVGLLGSFAGYYVMIAIVILALILATVTILGGGGGGSTAAQSGASATTSSPSSGGGFSVGEYLFPIIAISIPTALSGMGGVYFGTTGQSNSAKTEHPNDSKEANEIFSRNSQLINFSLSNFPTKKIGIGLVLLIVVVAGAVTIPSLASQVSSQLESDGDSTAYEDVSGSQLEVSVTPYTTSSTVNGQSGSVYATVEAVNPTNNEITTQVRAVLIINDETVAAGEEQLTVPAGETRTQRVLVVLKDQLSSSYVEEVDSGNYQIECIIGGQTVGTYRP